jgi:hypothetical protein
VTARNITRQSPELPDVRTMLNRANEPQSAAIAISILAVVYLAIRCTYPDNEVTVVSIFYR